jgi:hypothetical protein
LLNAILRISGTAVHSIGGTVTTVGPDATLLLTGCGLVRATTTGTNGAYLFEDLIDCPYRITVHQSGLQITSRDVVLAGKDLGDISFSPGAAPPDKTADLSLPKSPDTCQQLCSKFVSLTTAGGAGTTRPNVQLQYGLDAATFDLDRLPLAVSTSGTPGPEDTDEFLGEEDPVTHANACVQATSPLDFVKSCLGVGSGRIEPPVGKNSQHIYITIGQPVIGLSSSIEWLIIVGANP